MRCILRDKAIDLSTCSLVTYHEKRLLKKQRMHASMLAVAEVFTSFSGGVLSFGLELGTELAYPTSKQASSFQSIDWFLHVW